MNQVKVIILLRQQPLIQHKDEAPEIRGGARSQRGAITRFVGRSEGDETKQQ